MQALCPTPEHCSLSSRLLEQPLGTTAEGTTARTGSVPCLPGALRGGCCYLNCTCPQPPPHRERGWISPAPSPLSPRAPSPGLLFPTLPRSSHIPPPSGEDCFTAGPPHTSGTQGSPCKVREPRARPLRLAIASHPQESSSSPQTAITGIPTVALSLRQLWPRS